MSKITESNFLTTWDELFQKYFGRPMLLMLALIPIFAFIIVEFQSRANLNHSIKELESELTQSIISGDSFLATRVMKSLEKSLQLKSARLQSKGNTLVEIGSITNSYLRYFYWTSELRLVSPWGENVGSLKVQSKLFPIQRVISATFIIFSFLLLIILSTISKNYKKNILPIISEIQELTDELNNTQSGKRTILPQNKKFITDTALKLSIAIDSFLDVQKSLISKNIELEKYEATTTLAKQVAHDIRSPLAALNLVSSSLINVPEEKRLMIRNAIQRINDIANDLLSKSKQNSISLNETSMNQYQGPNHYLEPILLPALVDSLISEKRIQFRDQINIRIEADFKNSFGAFINANSKELMRLLSNLINNSIEAFPNKKGDVTISVRTQQNKVQLLVKDNGKGIPPEVLVKLGTAGVTHGKEGTQSGSGIGVYHAKKTIESFGGEFTISSQLNVGTSFDIYLPRLEAPSWFLTHINLQPNNEIICLDDDISIHQIWKGRLDSLQGNKKNVSIMNFTSPVDFTNYVQTLSPADLSTKIFFVDFELLGHTTNGLEVIENLKLQQKVILVTSRYEEAEIRHRCETLNVKLLPKSLAGFVPIEIETNNNFFGKDLLDSDDFNNRPKTIIDQNQKTVLRNRYDLCLLDDDKELIHTLWSMIARTKGHDIKMFSTPEEFLIEADSIDSMTPIFIDVSLGNGVSGVDFAEVVHSKGFLNINLATGYLADSINAPSFIDRIIGKDYPDFI